MGRPGAADLSVRGSQCAAARKPALRAEGTGTRLMKRVGAKKAKAAVARNIAVILHCI